MARYKHIDTSPKFIPVNLVAQLLPGAFEHALCHLIDHEIDLSRFDARYRNDVTGAPAFPPAMLLKVVLFGYSRGIVSSRELERACREHVTFIALSGDSAPHFTTIASFISSLDDSIAKVFKDVLFICDRQGLIGREMFAIDGVKLPSNASKAKSGKRADFIRQAEKLEAAAKQMLARHRQNDVLAVEPDLATKHTQRITRLQTDAAQLRDWLAVHPEDRMGSKGAIRKSNRTDNDSAKMATSKGVIQGYCGVAAVDDRHQIIMEAQAHGTGSEQALLMPMVDALAPHLLDSSLITADAGYHSAENLKQLADQGIAALIADNGMRQRDERFADQAKHKQAPHPLHNKHTKAINTVKANRRYKPTDFSYDKEAGTCICPAGKQLYQNGRNCIHNGYIAVKFQGAQQDCLPCEQRDKCLRHPDKTKTRQVSFFRGKADISIQSLADRMKNAIDSERGRALCGGRFATVEPVFGNLRHNKRLNRFTLRGQQKVDGQWKLFCLVHNIEKLAHHGYAQ